ncbi:Calx-beta domain-containing protein, partial [uncultured Lacinutrix sp.]|uniref:Calx-beta domain-containing protein n=1 Tax=uncultured Lacinutrix sp. TaxID=574032 RepID=UPI00262CA718
MKISTRFSINLKTLRSLFCLLIVVLGANIASAQSDLDWGTATWTPGAASGTIPFTTPAGYEPVSVTISMAFNASDGIFYNGSLGNFPSIDYIGGEFGGIDDLGVAFDPADNGRTNVDSPITMTLTFSEPVSGVSFIISDIDQSANRIDEVYLTSNAGDPVSITREVPIANSEIATITANTLASSAAKDASADDNTGSATVDFGTKLISTITVVYSDAGETDGIRGAGFFGGFNVRAASVLEATNDVQTAVVEGVGGQAISNVLTNDVYQAGSPTVSDVTLAQVSTTNPGVTLNTSTGAVDVASNVPAGNYIIEYRICETANSANCDTAFAYVTVLPDNDGDGIDDTVDLDDDNDGILDEDELDCSSGFVALGQNFNNNTTGTNGGAATASLTGLYAYNGVDVSASFDPQGNVIWNDGVSSASGAGVSGPYINTQPTNTNFSIGDVAVYTYTFSQPVFNVEFKFAGLDNSDRADFTANNSGTNALVLLSDINLGTDGIFFGQSVVSNAGGDNAPDNAIQVSIPGPITEITITVGKEDGNSGNVTMQFYELEYCIGLDTDGDGIPNIYDTDSDGDGCFDALEGGDNILATNVLANGQLDGTANAASNGVPSNVSSTTGQTVGGSVDGTPSDTNGQCDSDGDGVIDANDICNGFDDAADIDGDTVPDGCDLDNDNDGILDINECSPSKTVDILIEEADLTFTASGNPGNIGDTARYANVGSYEGTNIDLRITVLSNSDLANLEVDLSGVNFTPTNGEPTLYYPIYLASTNPAIVGFANFDFEFLINGTNTLIEVPANLVIQDIDDTTPGEVVEFNKKDILNYEVTTTTSLVVASSVSNSSFGNAGSFLKVTSTGNAAGAADENLWFGIQMPFVDEFNITFAKRQFDTGYLFNTKTFSSTTNTTQVTPGCTADYDNDGIPDYLDVDSDNDGCFDALEGGDNILAANVLANGQLDGTVDLTTGVPNNVNVNSGQAVGGSIDGTPSDSNGQCDSDNDGVIDADDLCPGFDDNANADGDAYPDSCDEDDDNDGISDIDEGLVVTNATPVCGSQTILNFNSSFTEESGDGNIATFLLNETFRFPNVTTGIDALVTITELNGTTVPTIDDNGSNPNSFQPRSAFNLVNVGDRAYTEYRFDFVTTGGTVGVNDVIIPNFFVNFNDVDGNERYGEQNWSQTADTHVVNTPTELLITEESNFIVGTSGINEYPGVTSNFPQVNYSTSHSGKSTYTIRLGVIARQAGASASGRQHNVQFDCPSNFVNPVTTTTIDTDGDGIPNHLDLDSDNDGCFDALEGNGGITSAQIDGNGVITGAINTNGIPNAANSGAGQGDSSSTDDQTIGDECKVNTIIGDVTVDEGDGTATVPVTIDEVSTFDTVIDITTTTGTAGTSDYTATTTTVTIPAGQTSVDVVIPILEDNIDEPNETFTVGGTVTSGNAFNPTPGTVTITDNDATPVVTIGDVTVDEGAGTATVPVTIDVPSSE